MSASGSAVAASGRTPVPAPDAVRASAGRVLAVASLSARETLRSRSMLVAVVKNLVLLGLLGLSAFALVQEVPEEIAEQFGTAEAREAGVRFLLLTGEGLASTMTLFVALFATVGSIANEIERGTILAVVARPVARWEIVLGKFLGNATLALVYLVGQMFLIGAVVALLTGVWVNDLLFSVALLSISVLIVVAVALAGSTRLSMVANAIAVTVPLFALSNIGTALLYGLATLLGNEAVQQAVEWVRFLLPVAPVSDQAAEVLAGPVGGALRAASGQQRSLPLVDWAWIYGIVYLVATLAVAAWSFARRDLR